MTATGLRIALQLQRGPFNLAAEASLPSGRIIALFGPSGAGKTTLLRCLAGLECAAPGVVALDDMQWQDTNRGLFLPPHSRNTGFQFQEPRLFDHLTVKENLQYGLRRIPASERHIDLEEVAATLELTELLERMPAQLSGGERQRSALGRALLASPRLLLLDEPFSALDRARKSATLAFLATLPRRYNMTIILVSHTLEDVVQIADHLVLLEQGKISGHGPLTTMLQRLDLSLAQREDAGAVIEATVEEHDDHYQLTTLRFADRQLIVSRLPHHRGEKVRLHIHARDISLSLQPPTATTILNSLPCRIQAIAAAQNPAQRLLSLEVADQILLARITRKSCDHLGLAPGMPAYAQIKSVALVI